MLDVKCSSITNSIGYEGMEPAWAVSTGLGTDGTKFSIPRVTNHNIQMENKCKEAYNTQISFSASRTIISSRDAHEEEDRY